MNILIDYPAACLRPDDLTIPDPPPHARQIRTDEDMVAVEQLARLRKMVKVEMGMRR